jgi:hypothetical protein
MFRVLYKYGELFKELCPEVKRNLRYLALPPRGGFGSPEKSQGNSLKAIIMVNYGWFTFHQTIKEKMEFLLSALNKVSVRLQWSLTPPL